MATMTHTAGPWTTQDEGPDGRVGAHVVAGDDLICRCEDWDGFSQSQDEANARLIVAAPDLAAACEAALREIGECDEYDNTSAMLRAALTKAGIL